MLFRFPFILIDLESVSGDEKSRMSIIVLFGF